MQDKLYFLQLTGKTNIDQPLNKDKDYSVAFKRISVYGVDERSGNGEDDKITFKAKSIDEVTIITEEEKVVFGKPKKNSQSQVLRLTMKDYWETTYAGDIDFETFYTRQMSKLIQHYKDKI